MAKRSKYDKYFSPGTHRSITAFSKHAAGGSKRRKSYTERRRNKIVGIVLACILGAAVVFTAAFFVTDTLLGISDANIETTQKAEKDNKGNKDNKNDKGGKNDTTAPADNQQTSAEIKARVGNVSLLAGGSGLDQFVSSLKSAGQNAVVIDFKDASGYLSYPSSIAAVKDKAPSSKAQANAAASVKKIQQSGIKVVARIYCFKDTQMPRIDRTMAVHYNKTQMIWLDNEASKGGKPWLSFGVMGGAMQPQGHAQILLNLIDFGMNLQEAGDAPRIQHEGATEPTGQATVMRDGGEVNLETGFSYDAVRSLMRKGHRVTFADGPYGGYQAIMRDPESGVYYGASESRKDGQAAGY